MADQEVIADLGFTASGTDRAALAGELVALPAFRAPPDELTINYEDTKVTADWLSRCLRAERKAMARWGDPLEGNSIAFQPDGPFGVWIRGYDVSERAGVELASALPSAHIISFASLYKAWTKRSYRAPVLGGEHAPLGWACALRGDGHRRLVSRRWLEFGPWHLVRGDTDLSFLAFHDAAADAAVALAQAKPAHDRFASLERGGWITPEHAYEHEIKGLYAAQDRSLKIVVHGRDVTEREMLDACAYRATGGSDRAKPIARIDYLFMEEAPARAHLHELWLRDLGCLAIIDGAEVRLDTDHAPVRDQVSW
ncbi:MAG: hypothetical protein H0T46_17945 [Deltaproteobacteria bacterium]|nr:hypothetical protein [Deltaproteobacteria bacterium]